MNSTPPNINKFSNVLKSPLKLIGLVAIVLIIFAGIVTGWTYTTPPDVECVNGTDAGCKIGNTKWNSTDVVTDFLKGDASNLTAVPAAQLTGTAPLAAIPATLTGKDADTVDGYHLNQGVRTTDSPTFAGINATNLTGHLNASNYNITLAQKVTSKLYEVLDSSLVTIASYVDSYSCDGSYCIYQPWYASGQVYAKNMSTGKVDYSGTFMSVMNSVTNVSSTSITKITLSPGRYSISIPNAPPHNRSIWFNQSNVSINGFGAATIYNDGTGAGVTGSYMKQGDNAVSNIEVAGITFDDALNANSTHQIIGFDYVVNNINIHHNRFINLYNAGVIINTETIPYAQNIYFRNNYLSKKSSHISGDFAEIMGVNIEVTDNFFDEQTAPSSAPFVPSFAKNMKLCGNTINKTAASAGGGFDLTPLAFMSGEEYAYSNILICDNIVNYATISVGGAGTGNITAAKGVLISNNNIVRGSISLSGGVRDSIIQGNNLIANGWIALNAQVSGNNRTQENIMVVNNLINASNNLGSIFLINQNLSKSFVISGNVARYEGTANTIQVINGNNEVTDLIVSNNICTSGKPALYSGTIAGGNISANNINC